MTERAMNLVRSIAICATVFSASNADGILKAQEDWSAKSQKKLTFYSLRLSDGKFDVNSIGLPSYNDYGDEIKFLEHPSIREELELTKQQETKLSELIKAFKEKIRSVLKLAPAMYGEPSQEFSQALQEEVKKVQSDLEALLLPHQQQRIKELTVRFAIRRDGIRQTLDSPKVVEQLQVSNEQRQQLFSTAQDLAKGLAAKTVELRTEFLKKIESVLPVDAEKEFVAAFKGFLESRLPPIDVIVWQSTNVEKLHEKLEEEQVEGEDFFGLFLPTSYSMDVDGRLVGAADRSGFSADRLEKLRREKIRLKKFNYCHALLVYLQQPELSEGLELTEEQKVELENLNRAFRDSENTLLTRRTELAMRGDYSPETAEQETQQRAKAGEDGLAEIDRILLPPQKEALKLISEGAEFVLGGFSYAIKYGNAGKRLKVSADDKKKIRDAADEFCKKVNEETKDWEQETIDRLLEVLNEEQREKFNALIGPPLKYTGCNIDLFIAQLQSTGQ